MRKGVLLIITVLLTGGILLGDSPDHSSKPKIKKAKKDQTTSLNNTKKDLEKKIQKWIRLLGHENFQIREKATEELKKIGKPAVPFLEKALKSNEPEVQWRARTILQYIEGLNAPKPKTPVRPQTQPRPPVPDLNRLFPRFKFGFGGIFPKELEKFWKDLGFDPKRFQFLFPQLRELHRMDQEFDRILKRFQNMLKGLDKGHTLPRVRSHQEGTFKIYRWENGKKIEETWRFRNGKWEKVGKQKSSTPFPPSLPKLFPPKTSPKSGYKLGVHIEPAPKLLRYQLGIANKGVVVKDVVKNSPAANAGIVKWDIILEINGKPVATPEEVRKILQQEGKKGLKIQILRQGVKMLIKIPGEGKEKKKGKKKFF